MYGKLTIFYSSLCHADDKKIRGGRYAIETPLGTMSLIVHRVYFEGNTIIG